MEVVIENNCSTLFVIDLNHANLMVEEFKITVTVSNLKKNGVNIFEFQTNHWFVHPQDVHIVWRRHTRSRDSDRID